MRPKRGLYMSVSSQKDNWYQNTIIYELHVRSFADGNGDGIGDFKGLLKKLDYLEHLGIGAVWLLPFYPSPLRDDGYDVADYMDIHPDYGTMADFRLFLREAHARGLKVITELVLNHTSDRHPWFRRACASPPNSRYRDFYVWNDTPDKYPEARIIFPDYEPSNWTWHREAGAYYWHRFYAHQPDLNFDNPEVRRAMLRVVDFWLGMGVDGMRLDAVPYLIERPGTTCENLPETHAYLQELRAYIDAKYPDRMLLAEANLWPEEAVSYFGQGNECHMAFHFPLMPRIFMSIWLEDRYPIIDILEQTPAIPENCQWALFLRNHDELTLEKISDEERDYMLHAYARNVESRINLGIRRRLAPLMQNNRRKMELINVLLFSFPGTPCLYYGDEIGMGDNYYLGDRNGVRTPMQWTPDRNGGFSSANPQALFLPMIIDPEYHYEGINVETQERSPSSFLWWMRRFIAVYKMQQPVLGRGGIRFLRNENIRVLSFLREFHDSRLLVVVNLSRFAQTAELDLEEFAGHVPVEAFGSTRFPLIGKTPYVLTLGGHDYYWLRLEKGTGVPRAETFTKSVLVHNEEYGIFSEANLAKLEGTVLPHLAQIAARDFPHADLPEELVILDTCMVRGGQLESYIVLAEDPGTSRLQSTYLLMPSVSVERESDAGAGQEIDDAVAYIKNKPGREVLTDGFHNPAAVYQLLGLMGGARKHHGRSGNFRTQTHSPQLLRKLLAQHPGPVRLVRVTPHTCAYALDNVVYIKFYRRPSVGVNPEIEILAHLNAVKFPGVPRLLAGMFHQPPREDAMSIAVAMEYMQGAVDGESYISRALGRFFEDVQASGMAAPDFGTATSLAPSGEPTSEQIRMVESYGMDIFRQLGQRALAVHKALAAGEGPSMSPEPLGAFYMRSLYQVARNQTHRVVQGLEQERRAAVEAGRPPLREFPEKHILKRFARLQHMEGAGMRIRIHGDFRLANVLYLGKDLALSNFDGDAYLPVRERSIKRSPLRDVAAMLFSIGITAEKALQKHLERAPADKNYLVPWMSLWRFTACNKFLDSYRAAAAGEDFLPHDEEKFFQLLAVSLFMGIERVIERRQKDKPEELPMLLDITHALLRLFP